MILYQMAIGMEEWRQIKRAIVEAGGENEFLQFRLGQIAGTLREQARSWAGYSMAVREESEAGSLLVDPAAASGSMDLMVSIDRMEALDTMDMTDMLDSIG